MQSPSQLAWRKGPPGHRVLPTQSCHDELAQLCSIFSPSMISTSWLWASRIQCYAIPALPVCNAQQKRAGWVVTELSMGEICKGSK